MLLISLSASLKAELTLDLLGTYETGVFDESAAEIVDYDPATKRLFVVNGDASGIDVLEISDPTQPELLFTIDLSPFGAGPTSVAVDPRKKYSEIAVAVAADPVTDPGKIVFFTTNGGFLNEVTVGSLPDMVIYSPNGKQVAVANEGEPDGGVDPEGSISLIDVKKGAANVKADDVKTIGFSKLDSEGAPDGLRVFPDAESIAQDLEPEYIAYGKNGKTLFATLQEANAVAIVDAKKGELEKVVSLGTLDHSIEGYGIDASDKDDAINIATWPVKGMFMPDSIASYTYKGKNYFITANEGDDRGEDERIKNLILDPTAFPNAAALQEDDALGRLGVSTIDGDLDGDGDYDELFSYGSRTFTIWDENGSMVFDSGDDFEQITALVFPDNFNANNDENDAEGRSDNKGPEPEAVTIGMLNGKVYAFIGLERIGGVMIYDVTSPFAVSFESYTNNRDFIADVETPAAGDLGPEGLKFIPADASPNGEPLLVVANEVSGTTSIFQIVDGE